MKFRFNERRKTLIIVFVMLVVVFESIAYVANMPTPRQQLFQLYVLQPRHLAAEYYPNNNPNIGANIPVTWYLGVTNNMGSVQLVSIRVELSNATIPSPNDKQLEPPAPVITDFARFVQDNETWIVPFVWSVTNATSGDGSTRITGVRINGAAFQLTNWSASKGYNFRMVFELWTWKIDDSAFEYGWIGNGQHQSAWLEVWFNMTNPGPTVPPPSQ